MAELKDELETLRKNLNKDLDRRDEHAVTNHNAVFRQLEAQLILAAGLFLALSAQFSKELSSSTLAVKILSLIVIILLTFSILFGILQHFMEASYFKRIALGQRTIRKELDFSQQDSIMKFFGAISQFSLNSGNSVKRWPTYVQMFLLVAAVILISVIAGLRLFGQ